MLLLTTLLNAWSTQLTYTVAVATLAADLVAVSPRGLVSKEGRMTELLVSLVCVCP